MFLCAEQEEEELVRYNRIKECFPSSRVLEARQPASRDADGAERINLSPPSLVNGDGEVAFSSQAPDKPPVNVIEAVQSWGSVTRMAVIIIID